MIRLGCSSLSRRPGHEVLNSWGRFFGPKPLAAEPVAMPLQGPCRSVIRALWLAGLPDRRSQVAKPFGQPPSAENRGVAAEITDARVNGQAWMLRLATERRTGICR